MPYEFYYLKKMQNEVTLLVHLTLKSYICGYVTQAKKFFLHHPAWETFKLRIMLNLLLLFIY